MGKTIGFWVISASVLTVLHLLRKSKVLGTMKTERNRATASNFEELFEIVDIESRGE